MKILLAAWLLFVPLVAQAESMQGSTQAAGNVVKGDVLYWEDQDLVVKEISGREVRVHVNAQTKIEGVAGKLKTGDKVECTVTPEGHALTIKLQIPDSGR